MSSAEVGQTEAVVPVNADMSAHERRQPHRVVVGHRIALLAQCRERPGGLA